MTVSLKQIFMKKSIILTAIFAAVLTVFAGAQDKETRDLKGFTRISFGVPGNLYINFGKEFSVVLEGDKDVMEETITTLSAGKLVIKTDDNWHFRNGSDRVTVHITMPELEALGVSGSGKAEITDPVTDADNLDLNVSGSGKLIAGSITADKLRCNISGSGNIVIVGQGSADNGEIVISGSGNYTGEQIEIDHLNVRVMGSGNCNCKAGDTLSASISGSGDVSYTGDPKIDARVSGSGKVRSR